MYYAITTSDSVKHYGVPGMRKGRNRWRNPDGTLTLAGKIHYGVKSNNSSNKAIPSRSDGKYSMIKKPSTNSNNKNKSSKSYVPTYPTDKTLNIHDILSVNYNPFLKVEKIKEILEKIEEIKDEIKEEKEKIKEEQEEAKEEKEEIEEEIEETEEILEEEIETEEIETEEIEEEEILEEIEEIEEILEEEMEEEDIPVNLEIIKDLIKNVTSYEKHVTKNPAAKEVTGSRPDNYRTYSDDFKNRDRRDRKRVNPSTTPWYDDRDTTERVRDNVENLISNTSKKLNIKKKDKDKLKHSNVTDDYIEHYGVPGMRKGRNRWRNPDGTLTLAGKIHYGVKSNNSSNDGRYSIIKKSSTNAGDRNKLSRSDGKYSMIKKPSTKSDNRNDSSRNVGPSTKSDDNNKSINYTTGKIHNGLSVKDSPFKEKDDGPVTLEVIDVDNPKLPHPNNFNMDYSKESVPEWIKDIVRNVTSSEKHVTENPAAKEVTGSRPDNYRTYSDDFKNRDRRDRKRVNPSTSTWYDDRDTTERVRDNVENLISKNESDEVTNKNKQVQTTKRTKSLSDKQVQTTKATRGNKAIDDSQDSDKNSKLLSYLKDSLKLLDEFKEEDPDSYYSIYVRPTVLENATDAISEKANLKQREKWAGFHQSLMRLRDDIDKKVGTASPFETSTYSTTLSDFVNNSAPSKTSKKLNIKKKDKDKLKHSNLTDDYIEHHGIRGMKWGVRLFQNKDGSLTSLGRERYGVGVSNKEGVVDYNNKLDVQRAINKDMINKYRSGKNAVDSISNTIQSIGKNRQNAARNKKQEVMRRYMTKQKPLEEINMSKMSYKDIDNAISRIQKEREYAELIASTSPEVLTSEKIARIIDNVGTIAAVGATAFSLAENIYRFRHGDSSIGYKKNEFTNNNKSNKHKKYKVKFS